MMTTYHVTAPHEFSAIHRCFEYEGHVYVDYETSEETAVYVPTQFDGPNEWFSVGMDSHRGRNQERELQKLTPRTS